MMSKSELKVVLEKRKESLYNRIQLLTGSIIGAGDQHVDHANCVINDCFEEIDSINRQLANL